MNDEEIIEKVSKRADLKPFLAKIKRHDKELYTHCKNVAIISEYIASRLNFTEEEVEEIAAGALIHDVGKIFIDLSILKAPRCLYNREFKAIKKHPTYGYEMCRDFGFSETILEIIRDHHENENGLGYPRKKTKMSKEVQIVSVADKYDAMTSVRPYKVKFSNKKALMEISKFCEGISYGKEIYGVLKKYSDESDNIYELLKEDKKDIESTQILAV